MVGGEGLYCPHAVVDNASTDNACAHPRCHAFQSIGSRQRMWVRSLIETRPERHARLRSWLAARSKEDSGPVMLIAVNAGFIYFFRNWVAQMERLHLRLNGSTLVLTDQQSIEAVRALGFRPLSTQEFGAGLLLDADTESRSSPVFAGGPSHSAFNAFALALLSDLVQLGTDVLWMDADTVLQSDPRPWLLAAHPYTRCSRFVEKEPDVVGGLKDRVLTYWPNVLCFNQSRALLSSAAPGVFGVGMSRRKKPDLQMMDDSRWDSAGPGNTGFVFIRSNCRTLYLSLAIQQSLGVLLSSQSDQRFRMRLLNGPYMRKISFALLPVSLFLNGPLLLGMKKGRWQSQEGMYSGKEAGFSPSGWIAAHASWVERHTLKPALLRKVNAWNLHNRSSYPTEHTPNLIGRHHVAKQRGQSSTHCRRGEVGCAKRSQLVENS